MKLLGKSLSISESGELIAFESESHTQILGARSEKELRTLRGRPLSFSPDDEQIATFVGGSESAVKIWDVAGGAPPSHYRHADPTDGSGLQPGWTPNRCSDNGGPHRIGQQLRSMMVIAESELTSSKQKRSLVSTINPSSANSSSAVTESRSGSSRGSPFETRKQVQIWNLETETLFHKFHFSRLERRRI